MTKKLTATAPTSTEPTPEHAPAGPTAAKPKGGRAKRPAPPPIATLELASEGYLGWMESQGKSRGTIASYSAELKLAMSELGAETQLADLTPEQVGAYFDCPRVTRLRSGRAKSQLSIDKTRRVLRLALVWAQLQGWIESAPLPKKAAPSEPAPAQAPTAPASSQRPKRTQGVTVVANDRVVLDATAAPESAA